LPEVETVRRGLAPFMTEATIFKAEARRPDLRFPLPQQFAARLTGARIGALRRRGKYLIADLDTKESLIIHLGMSGRFTVQASKGDQTHRPGQFVYAADGDPRHDHIVFHMSSADGPKIVFNDPRRFGFMDLCATEGLDQSRHFAQMGPEPLSSHFTAAGLNAALKSRRTSIKAALLDQRIVAGIGNIYACEALHRAKISPRRRAASVSGVRGVRLFGAVTAVLEEAIEAGGSSLKDFAGADGALGYFQHQFKVYGREGEQCAQCGDDVRRLVQAGRSTFFCPGCQR
ncbi:MAG: bifunctional DNA-formamidopyrimidine glycosylase/DNA-(apurinic or apyrimidinic site) lyase, partial [Pseudomonadota bacterium]